jgi:hypothetical protein
VIVPSEPIRLLIVAMLGALAGAAAWVRHKKFPDRITRARAPVDFGRMAKNLSKIRLALGVAAAVVATGLFLFNYFTTKPNLGVGGGLIGGAMIAPAAFLAGWLPGLALTWILKRLDWLFSP